MKKLIIIVVVLVAAAVSYAMFFSESKLRELKSFKSNYMGGIDRCVTAYSMNGTKIKEWCGKFDMQESTNQMFFDLDGKRVIVRGGLIISEER